MNKNNNSPENTYQGGFPLAISITVQPILLNYKTKNHEIHGLFSTNYRKSIDEFSLRLSAVSSSSVSPTTPNSDEQNYKNDKPFLGESLHALWVKELEYGE